MPCAVALIDADEFYVSCERVFDPRLLGRPVVVLSNNDGCVISRSKEAKDVGVRMGASYYRIGRLLAAHNVAVCSSNYALYADMSLRVMGVLQTCAPQVEVYSIDEAFVRLDAKSARARAAQGRAIRQRVLKWTGVPVSVGIAQTKTLAKLAARLAKAKPARGVCDLTSARAQDRALEATPVRRIWGIGPGFARRLNEVGIETARQLRDAELRRVRRCVSVVGARVAAELRGVSCLPLEECPPPQRSVTCSRSFGVAVESLAELREAVALYVTRAAERLRRCGRAAAVVTVFVETSRFNDAPDYYSNAAALELASPTDVTDELLAWARAGLERIYRAGFRYKKAGVVLSELRPAARATGRLFGRARYEQARRVMAAVDQINAQHGRDTVRLGLLPVEPRWAMKSALRSPRYTTRLSDVARVR